MGFRAPAGANLKEWLRSQTSETKELSPAAYSEDEVMNYLLPAYAAASAGLQKEGISFGGQEDEEQKALLEKLKGQLKTAVPDYAPILASVADTVSSNLSGRPSQEVSRLAASLPTQTEALQKYASLHKALNSELGKKDKLALELFGKLRKPQVVQSVTRGIEKEAFVPQVKKTGEITEKDLQKERKDYLNATKFSNDLYLFTDKYAKKLQQMHEWDQRSVGGKLKYVLGKETGLLGLLDDVDRDANRLSKTVAGLVVYDRSGKAVNQNEQLQIQSALELITGAVNKKEKLEAMDELKKALQANAEKVRTAFPHVAPEFEKNKSAVTPERVSSIPTEYTPPTEYTTGNIKLEDGSVVSARIKKGLDPKVRANWEIIK